MVNAINLCLNKPHSLIEQGIRDVTASRGLWTTPKLVFSSVAEQVGCGLQARGQAQLPSSHVCSILMRETKDGAWRGVAKRSAPGNELSTARSHTVLNNMEKRVVTVEKR